MQQRRGHVMMYSLVVEYCKNGQPHSVLSKYRLLCLIPGGQIIYKSTITYMHQKVTGDARSLFLSFVWLPTHMAKSA